jgi:hypothetical protein
MRTRSVVVALLLVAGCESQPIVTDAGRRDAGPREDAGEIVMPPACTDVPRTPPLPECPRPGTDYVPGVDDAWPACVSDSGQYERIQPSISTIARVRAYEEIEALLFDPSRDPDSDAFLQARLLYQEEQGLDSRVVRRYDPHFTAPEGTDCTLAGVPAMYPDYCVGPSTLSPILLSAFEAGITGVGAEPSRVHAARIQAALLWFLYASVHKETLTCTRVAADCDSAYAYYTGGEPARGGVGLAGDVAAVDPRAHGRAWDGVLAVRCWRDLDPGEVAADLERRELARNQLDRAVLQGVASIVRDRLVRLCDATGDALRYHHAFVQVLGRALDREAQVRDAAQAAALREELARPDPSEIDVGRAVRAIDAVFDCP